MGFVKEAVRGVLRSGMRWRARGKLQRLRAEADADSGRIYAALLDGVLGTLDATERSWVRKIEAMRRELEASTTSVEMLDFGAGAPGLGLTEAAMHQGRLVTKTVGEICRAASKPPSWCLLLFQLVRHLDPVVCLELGTSLGVSSSYLGAAQQVNGRGRVVTIEGAPALATLAQRNLRSLGLVDVQVEVGRFQDVLDDVIQRHRPLDFVFIDGHHEENATLQYFEQVRPALAATAVVVFDDIAWSDGMRRAWRTIEADPRVQLSVDLSRVGVVIVDRRHAAPKRAVKIPLV